MSVREDVVLQELRRSPQHHDEEHDRGSPVGDGDREQGAPEAAQAAQTTQEEWRPSRKYQAVMLAAGFTMIFHVIGINSIYGIFQVRHLQVLFTSDEANSIVLLGVLHVSCVEYQGRSRARRTSFTGRDHRHRPDMEREHLRQSSRSPLETRPRHYARWGVHHEPWYLLRQL